MSKAGTITHLVRTFGSTWGRIRPDGEERQVFFNGPSFKRPEDFDALREGLEVSFDEERDLANGTRAVAIVISKAAPIGE